MTREYAERIADLVVDSGLAVVWSQRIDMDDPDAGKKARSGWNLAEPWPKGNRGGLVAHLEAYHGKRNLLVVTDSSGVCTIDCDTQVGLEKYLSLGAPQTLTVRSGREGSGYHYIHRPPPEPREYTFFELAGDEETGPMVSGAASKKLHVLVGVHKTGREYEISDFSEIAELPQEVYDRLVRGYRLRVGERNHTVRSGRLVEEPGRHDYLVDWAQAYRTKLGKRGELLFALLQAERDHACAPGPRPITDDELRRITGWIESRV